MRIIRILSKRRKNLRGKSIRAAFVAQHNATMKYLGTYKNRVEDPMAKLNYFVIKYLTESVNAKLDIKFVSSWGYLDTNTGKWDGVMGSLISNQSDIGGNALIVIESRLREVDFLAMTTKTSAHVVFRAPSLSQVSNIYQLPFERDVWLCSIAFVIITILCIYSITRYDVKPQSSFSDSVILAVGAVCQTGMQFDSRLISTRIAIIVLFVAALFLFTSYTANIVALLQSSANNIRTVEDLLASDLDVGIQDEAYNKYFFKNTDDPVRKALYDRKIAPPKKPPNFFNLSYGVNRIRQGLFAFQMESGSGYMLMENTYYEHEKCGLKEIKALPLSDPWVPMKKNSPYREIMKPM